MAYFQDSVKNTIFFTEKKKRPQSANPVASPMLVENAIVGIPFWDEIFREIARTL